VGEKKGAQNIVKKKSSTRKSDCNTYRGWTQIEYKTSTTISTKMAKEHRMTKEEMEGPTSS